VLSHKVFLHTDDSSGQHTSVNVAGRLRHGIVNAFVHDTQPVAEGVWCATEARIMKTLQLFRARDWGEVTKQCSRPVPALLQGVPCFEVTVVDPGVSLADAPPEKVQVRFSHAELLKLSSSGWKQPAMVLSKGGAAVAAAAALEHTQATITRAGPANHPPHT
jgi:hypothetical protein